MTYPSLTQKPPGSWVQTDREAHEAWGRLAIKHPRASALLHVLVARVGEHNAVVASQAVLAEICGCSLPTLKRALSELRAGQWVEVRQIGPTGTACAYILNDKVVWSGPRDGIRYSLFSAAVILSEKEQPDSIDDQTKLRPLPRLFPSERQLPAGDGLPPPSEPALPGMEPDLPALREPDRRSEPLAIGELLRGIAVSPSDEVTPKQTSDQAIIKEA